MTCGCKDEGQGAGSGDCSQAKLPIRPNCRRVYGGDASDLVDGLELQRQLDAIIAQLNRHSEAFDGILDADCSLKDAIVFCRNLAPEVGTACLFTGEAPPPPVPPGPLPGGPVLDYPGLEAAYGGWSLRRLTTNYTGPLIRIRRALDNAELDVGVAANNLLDTAAIIAFAQGSDCFVVTIYEQVEQVAGHNLTQTTPSQQPKIYDSITGFVINASGRLAIFFDGVDDGFASPVADMPITTRSLIANAIQWHTESNGYLINQTDQGGAIAPYKCHYRRPNANSQYFDTDCAGRGVNISVSLRLNEPWLVTMASLENASPGTLYGRLNGSLQSTDPTGGFTLNTTCRMNLGQSADATSAGNLIWSETILYSDTLWTEILPDLGDSILKAVEDNMMATWGITPD